MRLRAHKVRHPFFSSFAGVCSFFSSPSIGLFSSFFAFLRHPALFTSVHLRKHFLGRSCAVQRGLYSLERETTRSVERTGKRSEKKRTKRIARRRQRQREISLPSLNKQQGWRINERGCPGRHLWLPPEPASQNQAAISAKASNSVFQMVSWLGEKNLLDFQTKIYPNPFVHLFLKLIINERGWVIPTSQLHYAGVLRIFELISSD